MIMTRSKAAATFLLRITLSLLPNACIAWQVSLPEQSRPTPALAESPRRSFLARSLALPLAVAGGLAPVIPAPAAAAADPKAAPDLAFVTTPRSVLEFGVSHARLGFGSAGCTDSVASVLNI